MYDIFTRVRAIAHLVSVKMADVRGAGDYGLFRVEGKYSLRSSLCNREFRERGRTGTLR